ncbi:MAG: hypothetical protein ACYTBZ_28950 [Planctomycetota bacterium]
MGYDHLDDLLDEAGPPYRDETSNTAQWTFIYMAAGVPEYKEAAIERFGCVPRSFQATEAIEYVLKNGVRKDA